MPLRTAAAYVALGTGASRVTGLLRFVALAWALGQTPLADSYNLANTTPNMLYDVVLGGVLSATFIPVFVDRLANRSEDEAFDSISAVCTVSVVVLLATTLVALLLAPEIVGAFTALDAHGHPAQLERVAQERAVATTFLRWFVIQIAAYGLFALGAALLNTRRRFVAVAWAPIVNNLVCIGDSGVVRALGRARRRPVQRRGPPRPAHPPRSRHVARRRAPGRGPRAQPARGGPRPSAVALEPS